jgi:hypothetical protein
MPDLATFDRWARGKQIRSRPVALARRLMALDPASRPEAERLAFVAWGRPGGRLDAFRRSFAWSLALELDVASLAPGRFAFHALDPDGRYDDAETLAERLAALRTIPRVLADEVGYPLAELRAMSARELRRTLDDVGCPLLTPTAGTPKLAQASSIDRLLAQVLERGLIDDVHASEATDQALLREIGRGAEYLRPFLAIADLQLRRQAVALHGRSKGMKLSHDKPGLYLWGVLLRRPQWRLLGAWNAMPPRQDDAWCILMRPRE